MNASKSKYIAKYKTTLLSTGVPSFDTLISGGLSIGTVTLIEEDMGNSHCSLFCKHIISCGLTNGQETALIIDDQTPEMYLEILPKIFDSKPAATITDNFSNLDIAWRYKMLRNVEEELPGNKESEAVIGDVDMSKMSTFSVNKNTLSDNLSDSLQFIETFIKTRGGVRKPLRLVISSLGSPFWGTCDEGQSLVHLMSRFMFCLRRLVVDTYLSIVISINPDLFEQTFIADVFRASADYAFKFAAVTDPTMLNDKTYSDVSGQVRIVRIPCINSIEPIFRPNTIIWSYQVRRRKIVFKEFTLAPCLADNTSRSDQTNPSMTIATKIGCGVDF